MTNKYWLIVAVAVFLLYNVPIALKWGIQPTISYTYNLFRSRVAKSLFSWFIIGISLPLCIAFNKPLGVVAGMLLMLDFAAPACKHKLQSSLHVFGAYAGVLLGMASLIIYFHEWYLVAVWVAFSLSALKHLKNPTYWIETSAFFTVITGLLIK